MKHVAVVYSNRTRQSRLVADRIREVLYEAGIESEGILISKNTDAIYEGICRFDAVIVGGPSLGLRLPLHLQGWICHHAVDLAKVPCYLFSISTQVGGKSGLYPTYMNVIRDFVNWTGIVPQRSICVSGSNRIEPACWLRQLFFHESAQPARPRKLDPDVEALEWEKVTRFAQRVVADTLAEEALTLADFTGMEK